MSETGSRWEAVIGLEIHAQLLTRTKIFCGCEARYGGEPNTRTCPVCLGLPGALPVLSRQVVEYALLVGLACECRIDELSVMARKNYFYPDLPKGYQISQFERPLCIGGALTIGSGGSAKRIRLTRIHIEEDAGKSIHGRDSTRIDLNRSGVPLIEIVTEPDLRSPKDARACLDELKSILVYLRVCDGNMEESSLRCDANVSIREAGSSGLGAKTEIKNLNSFRGVEAALNFEIDRQIDRLNSGERVKQETLLWDAEARVARAMRSKEEAHDYRYFPEPDLLPVRIDAARLGELRAELPELPAERRARFSLEYGLSEYDARQLTMSRELADYFEIVARSSGNAKLAANWVLGEVLRHLKQVEIALADFPVAAEELATLLGKIEAGAVSGTAAKSVFERLAVQGGSVDRWVEKLGLAQISDPDELAATIDLVIARESEAARRCAEGELKLLGFLVGQVMRESGGKANPEAVRQLLEDKLS